MLPNRCSVREKKKDCVNPPFFVISIVQTNGEYMIGVSCKKHQENLSKKLHILQNEGKIPHGKIKFSELKGVGTDCVRADSDIFQL